MNNQKAQLIDWIISIRARAANFRAEAAVCPRPIVAQIGTKDICLREVAKELEELINQWPDDIQSQHTKPMPELTDTERTLTWLLTLMTQECEILESKLKTQSLELRKLKSEYKALRHATYTPPQIPSPNLPTT